MPTQTPSYFVQPPSCLQPSCLHRLPHASAATLMLEHPQCLCRPCPVTSFSRPLQQGCCSLPCSEIVLPGPLVMKRCGALMPTQTPSDALCSHPHACYPHALCRHLCLCSPRATSVGTCACASLMLVQPSC
eukprot:1158143-Pelagomonas_calceolata.AAC.4